MKLTKNNLLFAFLVIALTVGCKLLFANRFEFSGFSPIIAVALFAGMTIKDKSQSFALPLIALFASDVVIEVLHRLDLFAFAGLYKYQLLNYAILLVATFIGWAIKGNNYKSLIVGAIAAPTAFFLISNFSVWVSSEVYYTRDLQGILNCYAQGLPFYRNSLVSTFIFLPVLIAAYNYLVKGKRYFSPVLA